MSTVYVPSIYERKRIPKKAIDDVVRRIVQEFRPRKIILFGSYARGNPRPESDVDLLVVMDAPKGESKQSLAIRRHLNVMFGLDLIVYSPEQLRQRLEWGDSFLQEVIETGKVLHESADA